MIDFTEQTTASLDVNNTSSVTTGLDIKDNQYVAWSINHKTGTRTTYSLILQCSTDNTNWENTASTIVSTAGAYKIADNVQTTARYVRIKCAIAEGSAATAEIVINSK